MSAEAVAELLDGMKKVQEELKIVRQGQEETSLKLARSARKETYAFKKRGNELQFRFNEQVVEKMEAAKACLKKLEVAAPRSEELLERAASEMTQGMELITRRQKMIKFADRSESGWAVVEEYEDDDLADDSEDEKRMEKAERLAEKKLAKKRKLREVKAKEVLSTAVVTAGGAPFLSKAPFVEPAKAAAPKPSPRFPMGTCFQCGDAGHWRKECPKAGAVAYPFPTCEHVVQDMVEGEVVNVSPSHFEQSCEVLECMPSRCWEVQEGEKNEGSVRGRLKEGLAFWREDLGAPPWILDTIENGYVLPLYAEPTPYSRPNQQSALVDRQFVEAAVVDLLKGGYIETVTDPPYVCSPLSVITNQSGKKRLVLNLRHVNKFLWKQKFKYEDLRVALALFEPGEWMFAFDLKSGYHHIDVAPHHRKYLGFEWDGKFYTFVALPFGLSSAPYVFTKLMRVLVRLWRSKGLKSVVYLDDGICASQNEVEALSCSCWVKETLAKAGWVHNELKSVWTPTHRLQWLGFEVDLKQGCISVPAKKINGLKANLQIAASQTALRAKFIASLVGKIVAMSLALGSLSRFMTRALYAMLQGRNTWCDMLVITPEAKVELQFWVECLDLYNSQPIWHSPSAVRCVYSDASDTGYGGYTVEHGMHIAQGNWLPEEAGQSSTWRELVAVGRVLESVASKLCGMHVRWFTDNQNVVRILQVGSSKPHLQVEALRVFKSCVVHNIKLEPEWVPRDENQLADYFSRIIDHDDWYIDHTIFEMLEATWGPHTVDRFATHYNAQVKRFNSRYACPGSEAVDAFTVNWFGENNWWCPPPALIPRVLKHAECCKAQGTLVVPCWSLPPSGRCCTDRGVDGHHL